MNDKRQRRSDQGARRKLLPREAPDWETSSQRWDDLPSHDAGGNPYPAIKVTDLPADIVLPRLRRVSGSGPTWSACCPAHGDFKPSLSVTEKPDATLLVHCHVGCPTEKVMSAIGLDMTFLFPSDYALRYGKRQGRTMSRAGNRLMDDTFTEPVIDYGKYKKILRSTKATGRQVNELALSLGLPWASLVALRVGYCPEKDCWVFPERDWKRRVVGLTYRSPNGEKTCEPGSKRGLTIPHSVELAGDGPVFLPEGATDTAALHSVGALAIGRPAAQATRLVKLWLGRFLRKFESRPIIVVGDRDKAKNGNRAGFDGAQDLALYLRLRLDRPVRCALPARGFKDVREQVVAGEWDQGLCFMEDAE